MITNQNLSPMHQQHQQQQMQGSGSNNANNQNQSKSPRESGAQTGNGTGGGAGGSGSAPGNSVSRLAFYDFSDQDLMNKDRKYNQYAQGIDKALKSFEYTSEWADLVSALAKLNRALSGGERFHRIPRRFIVGQRLAQCMHPLLPSGVHLKALETYNLIFGILGEEQLLADLTIYSNGLFPLLSYAAINVRPSVLDLYERHLLPLGDRLKLALDGFLISLLPCYEEGSDSWQRTDVLLQDVATGVGEAHFYCALWRCIMQNSAIRLPAITFVLMHFNKKRPLPEQSHVLGLCMRTLVRAICAALLDANILVQRAILDLLTTVFPLHKNSEFEMNACMSSPTRPGDGTATSSSTLMPPEKITPGVNLSSRIHFKRSELVAIITSALTVLLRRDLSLNRRLCAWFFGSDSSSSTSSSSMASDPTGNSATGSGSYFTGGSSSSLAFNQSSKAPIGKTVPPAKTDNSSETRARRKRMAYFEAHARDLVVEAYKRCITNPLTAITSILPPTALTNSFITFTLPMATFANQTPSASSSPSSSTSSLLVPSNSYRGGGSLNSHSLHSSFSSHLHAKSGLDQTYSPMSTFWPYRLLNCILDQRDIAAPILEKLGVDILRGLYHEFELLTTVVPPPNTATASDPTKTEAETKKKLDPDGSLSSNLNGSSTTLSSASLVLNEYLPPRKPKQKLSRKVKRRKSGSKAKANRRMRKISSSSKRDNAPVDNNNGNGAKNLISASAPTVAVTDEIGTQSISGNRKPGDDTGGNFSADDEADETSLEPITEPPNTAIVSESSTNKNLTATGSRLEQQKPRTIMAFSDNEDFDEENLTGKRNQKLFSNLRKNVRDKFPFRFQFNNKNSGGNNAVSPNDTTGANRMKAIKTFITRLKVTDGQAKFVPKLKRKKSSELRLLPNNVGLPERSVSAFARREGGGRNSFMLDKSATDDDDSVFLLPHQHYYWNNYYQQMDKSQRQELLKELDRVMHLLLTNVGVEFVWFKLLSIFQSAADEAILLRKFLHWIIKSRTVRPTVAKTTDVSSSSACDEDNETEVETELDDDDGDPECWTKSSSETDDGEKEDEIVTHTALSWVRTLASTLLDEMVQQPSPTAEFGYSGGGSPSSSSSSTTPFASPRICSPALDGGPASPLMAPSMLKNRLLSSLGDRCRQCGEILSYNSPVQPVGTDSTTILEACTLARFLLGDSQPYHLSRTIADIDDRFFGTDSGSTTFSMLANSVSASMNRCSALEPLGVDTPNYQYLIQFLHLVLNLMSQTAKAFTPTDLRASIELCLAFSSKLKPAIMQTFVSRYRSQNELRNKEISDSNANGSGIQQHSRKPSLNTWFNTYGQPANNRRVRSSPSTSSARGSNNKPLELVKEEDGNDDEDDDETALPAQNLEDDIELNDDFQLELVVDGVLKFFSTFVEAILVKNPIGNESESKSKAKQCIFDYYQKVISIPASYSQQAVSLTVRHQLLPVYQLLCELLIEVGTLPLLSSPGFLLKKRDPMMADGKIQKENQSSWLDHLNGEQQSANPYSHQQRWFTYLMVLSSNSLSSCSHWHLSTPVPDPLVCCQLRHVAYTSLATILDLMTMTRAYVLNHPGGHSNILTDRGFDEFLIPSYVDMSAPDLFPSTFIAKRLNFFPLIHPKMLQQVYDATQWFRLIGIRLWSNLSASDSPLHHSTVALLQQLHSVSNDESICEMVICDEMVGQTSGGGHSTGSYRYATDSTSQHSHRILMHSMSNPGHHSFNVVHRARAKFALMFSLIRDIRFISERLALVVTSLAAAAKSADGRDIDSLVDLNLNVQLADATATNYGDTLSDLSPGSIDLPRYLRLTSPISPVALCSTLKRHFDRPLFIMLDALSQRRAFSDQFSMSADWLLQCITPSNLFGAKNLMFTAPNGFGLTSEFKNPPALVCDQNQTSDIGRLLEPLLFILLHPNTARLSVKMVNVLRYSRSQKDSTGDSAANLPEQMDESKIYAISPTNGNAIYHVKRQASGQNEEINDESDTIKQVLDDLVNQVVDGLDETDNVRQPKPKAFPGMASYTVLRPTSPTNEERRYNRSVSDHSRTKLKFADMHLHLLLYEQRYDSVRTCYALDTLLSMVETWPTRVLYSMATSSVGNGQLDGTRMVRIRSLHQQHRNSIKGDGFCHHSNNAAGKGVPGKNRRQESTESQENSNQLTMLELLVEVCLQYLRSYYSSCPADTATTKTANKLKVTDALDELFQQIRSSQCIDLEAIYGNQKVRLVACETLRVIFYHLSQMIETPNAKDSKHHHHHHKRNASESLLCFTQSKTFVTFLKDLLQRCEVQRNVLQCLVTSVWHYDQNERAANHRNQKESEDQPDISWGRTNKPMTSASSYLFPARPSQKSNPADNAFIKEILDHNDYPEQHQEAARRRPPNHGFHDELEKSLLRLLEQVMILEHRIQSTLTEPKQQDQSSSTVSSTSSDQRGNSVQSMASLVKNLAEISFEPELPLAGQPLLCAAVHYALQQNYRRQVHGSWLSFVETCLHHAGRFIPRLVNTVIQQLCRNLDASSREVEQFSGSRCFSAQSDTIPPFTYRHFLNTLQGIAMIYSYCLLDRNQYDALAPVLAQMNDETDIDAARMFGMTPGCGKNSRFLDSDFGLVTDALNVMSDSTTGTASGSTGPMQAITSILHNIMVMTPISSGQTNGTNAAGASETEADSLVPQPSTLSASLFRARQRIVGQLSRVLTALFNVWCTMVLVESDDVGPENSRMLLSSCCHPCARQSHRNRCFNVHQNPKHFRCSQSSCGQGWSSSAYTGWYITGSSLAVKRSTLTILSIISMANGPALLKSIARVWHDLRDRSRPDAIMADAIHVVVTPPTPTQQKLVQFIASLSPILNLDSLIQIARSILKQSQSTAATTNNGASALGQEVGSTEQPFTSNPFDNIFLTELSLLEFFLAYLRTCSRDALLKSCRSMLGLIKDGFAMNISSTVPFDTFWPRNRHQRQQVPSMSVQINFKPLINIHLLAIMHEFVIAASFMEDRRAQKELQEMAQRLIEANIDVAGGRLLPPRFWAFRRNFEVMPVNNDLTPSPTLGRPSPTASTKSDHASSSITDDSGLPAEVHIKRGFFRSSASIQFHHQNQSHDSAEHRQQDSEGLLFGLFNFNASYLTPTADLASTSQNLFYSYFCIKALYAMAEFAAPVLDVVYSSEEKEKMIPLITNLMSYVIPYLKSHSQHNLPCFDACSRILASLSGYQYTRKAWRRESLELLLDPAFYQMPAECLDPWRTIIDHLMAHDKNTFREFLQRMSVAQSPSVSFKIFVPSSTKDQDSEPRAQLVKRLAFILFCSEKDQYQKYMAEIQEKLIEIHRTSQQLSSQQPAQQNIQSLLQSQVLLAFRVILLRMSSLHLASLWPFIYTEMFQVFLTMEQTLLKVIREERKNSTDQSCNTNGDSGMSADVLSDIASHVSGSRSSTLRNKRIDPKIPPAQLQLFLNACKLLDLALLLPSDQLPQFQLHKWAFISDPASNIQSFDWFNFFGGLDSYFPNSKLPLPDNISTVSNEGNEPSSLNLDTQLDNFRSQSETNSLNSNQFDSTTNISIDSAPKSLPVNLSNMTTGKDQARDISTYIPHIVFLNHLLNYLSDSQPRPIQTPSPMSPLLTVSSIESIFDLHPFFSSLLSRSNQGTTFMPQSCSAAYTSFSMARPGSRQDNNRKSVIVDQRKPQKDNAVSTNNVNTSSGYSLEDLFINIDRIIANDFLEPLPRSDV